MSRHNFIKPLEETKKERPQEMMLKALCLLVFTFSFPSLFQNELFMYVRAGKFS